jgi:hypothetical protein
MITFSSPNAKNRRLGNSGAGTNHAPLARVPRAHWRAASGLCSAIFLSLWFSASPAPAANVRNYVASSTNSAVADTNYLIITKISPNILANGGVIANGLPVRTPYSPYTNSLPQGFYSVTNPIARGGYVINVADNGSQLYDCTNILYSGYNTYAYVYGSNSVPTLDQITNALSFLPASIAQLNTTSNYLKTNLTANLNTASNVLQQQITSATNSGITAATATNISAYQAKIATNDLNTTLVARITSATNGYNAIATNIARAVSATNNTTGSAGSATWATNLALNGTVGGLILRAADVDNSIGFESEANSTNLIVFWGDGAGIATPQIRTDLIYATNLPYSGLSAAARLSITNAAQGTGTVVSNGLSDRLFATNTLILANLTNHSTVVSNGLSARLFATNTALTTRIGDATNDLNTVLRALIGLKQFGSQTLTNLSATGAETNRVAVGGLQTATTNAGVITISGPTGTMSYSNATAYNLFLTNVINAIAPAAAGAGIQTNGGTGINNTFTNATLQFSSANWGSNNVNAANNRGNSILSGEANTLGGVSPGQGNLIVGGLSNVLSSANNHGSLIAGGIFNSITINSWAATISGGWNNLNRGLYGVIPGGLSNQIAANTLSAFASGQSAFANHDHTFVWSDAAYSTPFASTANNQFLIQSTNGVGINTNNPGTNALKVFGNIDATTLSARTATLTNVISTTDTTTNLNIGARSVFQYTTNEIAVTNAGTASANGGYRNVNSTHYTNDFTGSVITNNTAGNWQIKNGTTVLYSSTTPVGNTWTIQSGASAAPTTYFGSYFLVDGSRFLGVLESTNLDARIAAAAGGSGQTEAQVNAGYPTNLAANAAQIAAIMGTNNAAGAKQMPEQFWKLNSRTSSKFYADLSSLYWGVPDANSVLIRVDTNGNYLLNENKNPTPIYAWLQYPFRPPVGSTQVLVSADFYSIYGTNTGMRYAYTTPSTAISLLETNFTVPASGPTNIALNYNTTTSDLGLLLWPIYSGSHNSSVLISNLTLSFLPAPTNAGMVGSWKRSDILPRYLNHDALNTTRYIYAQKYSSRNVQACSRLQFNTSATNLTIESVSESSSWPFYVFTNGVFAQSFTPTVRASEYWDVVLSGINNDVEIIYPISQNFPDTGVHVGSFVRGIFCAADASINFVESKPDRKFWVFGDSIQIWGRGEGGLWPRLERLIDIDYTLHAIGGSGLTNMWATDRINFLRSFVAAKASDAYIAIGFNDYFGSWWGTNAFATNYGNMLDLMHQASPGTTIYCQAPIVSANESANALGLTLSDFRKVIADQAQARSNFVVYIAGTNLLASTSYLEDFAHPSELGFALYSKNLLPYFDAGPPSDFTQRGDRFLANNLGSITRTVFGPLENPTSGLYFPAANVPGMAANGTDVCWWLGNDTYMSRSGFLFWALSLGGSVDTGFGSANAGEVEVNNGGAGVYRDLRLRNITGTNGTFYGNLIAGNYYGAGGSITNVKAFSGTNGSGVVTPNISLYITNQDGKIYRVAADLINP